VHVRKRDTQYNVVDGFGGGFKRVEEKKSSRPEWNVRIIRRGRTCQNEGNRNKFTGTHELLFPSAVFLAHASIFMVVKKRKKKKKKLNEEIKPLRALVSSSSLPSSL